jgi:protoheme ferro-lyase
MIGKFLWGAAWRTLAFTAVAGAPLWYVNQGSDWSGQAVIEADDTRIEGKAGVLIVALIQPENFDQRFYSNFVEKIFAEVIPWPINVLAGADAGVVLVDPDKPYQQARYEPKRLADIWGREADIDGVPWIEKFRRGQLRWEKPSTTVPHDFGFYLYPARKQGMRTSAAKTVIKARFIYYPELPGGYLPHASQTRTMAEGAVAEVKARHGVVAAEVADAFDPYAKQQAVFRVLDAGADTLVLASAQPIYSDFEELSGSFVSVRKSVEEWRKRNGGKPIKIVIPPYLASQPAFDKLVLENFANSVPRASAPGQSAMGILSLHGLPVSLLGSDSWSGRVATITKRLVPQAEAILKAKGYAKVEAHVAPEGFGDTLEDPDNVQTSVHELFRRAEREGFAVAVATPLEFMAENTDALFAHSALMFDKFPGYRTYMGPPPGTDWAKPYVRRFQLGKTAVIYAGAPGGDTLPRQSSALADAIGAVFGK